MPINQAAGSFDNKKKPMRQGELMRRRKSDVVIDRCRLLCLMERYRVAGLCLNFEKLE